MPSPFPGMDPYLESPSHWPGVHTGLLQTLREMLVPQVRPHYFVDLERRVYILDDADPAQQHIVPDLTLIAPPASAAEGTGTGAAAAAASGGTVLMMMDVPVEIREARLVVRTAASLELVTVIELLSHANKTKGSRGREEYLAKRREVMNSKIHLIEIDLLRAGLPIPSIERLPPGDYRVHVSRWRMRPRGQVFTWTVRDAAPVIPVPLREGEPEVRLDLGEAIRSTYDRSGYDVLLNYRGPAEPPLAPEAEAWAKGLPGGVAGT
ncbi:MAG: DUF4058 family protein [Planctomycetes bacterium]|nr:DUF4058 family protein [Planctomycetota bacterium]